MQRLAIRLALVLAAGVLVTTAAFRFGYHPARAVQFKPPAWIKASEKKALRQSFGAPKPLRTYYIAYPRKIAVVWVFSTPVTCVGCPGEPGGTKIVRTSFSRTPPHSMFGSGNFCIALARCLRR